jgi:hypothetical protein
MEDFSQRRTKRTRDGSQTKLPPSKRHQHMAEHFQKIWLEPCRAECPQGRLDKVVHESRLAGMFKSIYSSSANLLWTTHGQQLWGWKQYHKDLRVHRSPYFTVLTKFRTSKNVCHPFFSYENALFWDQYHQVPTPSVPPKKRIVQNNRVIHYHGHNIQLIKRGWSEPAVSRWQLFTNSVCNSEPTMQHSTRTFPWHNQKLNLRQ